MTIDQLVTAPHDVVAEDPAQLRARRMRAVRAVASAATDSDDCGMLLEALGLRPEEGIGEPPAPRSGN
ncbi:MAG TPA: hypothetical protein VFV67_30455 [Actinophytocola sp.]|uniref:hypothetical protein n=1 Tax=Actinophytocola sp. TaxID=1872138 RepID=UPI002DB7D21C|nr:hypothetical protein [Actinophytocola sp.]HEU5474986.1 hypothetical protein [Actinophytocola sp.]